MEKCNFNENCNILCDKYPLCSYMSTQKQLSEMQQQINFIYRTLKDIIEKCNINHEDFQNLNEKLEMYAHELLDLYNYGKKDSEKNSKESNNEKEN